MIREYVEIEKQVDALKRPQCGNLLFEHTKMVTQIKPIIVTTEG